jgi:hypothetical protein
LTGLGLCLCVPAAASLCYANTYTKTIPFWNADEEMISAAPGQFDLDTTNQLEGSGCISINFGNGSHFDASITVPTVDTTNVTAFEFDMYISDLAILECLAETRAAIRLSPAKSPEVSDGEIRYGLNHVSKELMTKPPQVGWNHIVILMEDMADPVSWAACRCLP